jgi:hypothetical protein
MWIHCNGVDHTVDKQGLPFPLSRDVEAAIHKEFRKGTQGLSWRDFHFICRGQDNVMSLLEVDKQGWLQGIQLARDFCVTGPPAHWQQQQLMKDFFWIADDWYHLCYQCLSYIPSPSIECRILSCISSLMVTPSHSQLWFDQVGGSIMDGSSFSFYVFSIGWNRQVVLTSNIGSQVTLNSQQGNSILSANNLWVICLFICQQSGILSVVATFW